MSLALVQRARPAAAAPPRAAISQGAPRLTRRRRGPALRRARAARARASAGTRAGGRGRRGPTRARPAAARTAAGRKPARGRSSSSTSRASSRSSPRNQRASGTPKPVFPRPATSGGSASANARRSATLPSAARDLQRVRQRDAELEHLVVEERRAQLERVRHRRDVGLQQQVAGEVGADVEPLQPGDARSRRAERAPTRRRARARTSAPTARRAARRERPPSAARSARPAGSGRDLEEAAGAVGARARLPPGGRQQAQRRGAARRQRHRDAPGEPVRGVPLVPGERLVAAVARERDGDVPARQLGDEELRQRRLVAERLVERGGQPRQRRRRRPARLRSPRAPSP